MKYRKKPIVIDAIKWDGSNFHKIADFCGLNNLDIGISGKTVFIKTPEGIMTGNIDDYIIKGIKGEFYPCRKDIFEASYDPVEEA